MEAPEKIWMTDDWVWQFDDKDFMGEDSIEYIRTDAFIEKALKFLDENFYFNNLHYGIESGVFDSKEEMFEDFKKYMEE